MAVLFDSSSSNYATNLPATTSLSTTHVVNTLAVDLVAIVGVFWVSKSDTTGGTLSATFDGVDMTPSTPISIDSNRSVFQAFTLSAPNQGSKVIDVSATSMGGLGTLAIVAATYSGVDQIGDLVIADTGTVTANSVTVDSVIDAYRVVTMHAVGGATVGYYLTGYDKVQRASQAVVVPGVGEYGAILMGDAPGAPTVTASATQPSTANWGAFGIPLTPAFVRGDASLNISMGISGSGHLYRSGIPSPLRTWVIES